MADLGVIDPSVQRARDQERLRILQAEQQANPNDKNIQGSISDTQNDIDTGKSYAPVDVSRGTKISSELNQSSKPVTLDDWFSSTKEQGPQQASQKQVSLDDWFPDSVMKKSSAKQEEPGFFASIPDIVKTGFINDMKSVASAKDAILKNDVGVEDPQKLWERPIETKDLSSPKLLAQKALYQVANGGSVMAGGIAGAALSSEGGPLGMIAGGALGASALTMAKELGPIYKQELRNNPKDKDAAFDNALSKAGQESIFSGIGWGLFGIPLFKNAVKNLVTQAFVVQPAVNEAQHAVQNVQAGNPAEQGLGESYLGSVVGTVVPAVGMHAAHTLVSGKEAQAKEIPAEAAAVTPVENPIQTPPPTPIEQARIDSNSVEPVVDPIAQRNATLVATYGENPAVRHVIENSGLSGLADTMARIAPKVEEARAAIEKGNENRDITSDILTALDEVSRIKAEGKSVDEVLAHGLPHEVSYEGQQLLKFIADNADKPERIGQFMENYLQAVKDMGGIPSEVRGKTFDILAERSAAKRAAEEKLAYEEKQNADDQKKQSELQPVVEQTKAENLLTELAKARASGGGINPEHQTAMELAFSNAKKLKEGKNAKPSSKTNEPVRSTQAIPEKSKPDTNQKLTKQLSESISSIDKNRLASDTQSVRKGRDITRNETVSTKPKIAEQISSERVAKNSNIMVSHNTIDMKTGKRVTIERPASEALKENDHHTKTMEALLECLA